MLNNRDNENDRQKILSLLLLESSKFSITIYELRVNINFKYVVYFLIVHILLCFEFYRKKIMLTLVSLRPVNNIMLDLGDNPTPV